MPFTSPCIFQAKSDQLMLIEKDIMVKGGCPEIICVDKESGGYIKEERGIWDSTPNRNTTIMFIPKTNKRNGKAYQTIIYRCTYIRKTYTINIGG